MTIVGTPTLAVVAVGQDPNPDGDGELDNGSDSVNTSKTKPSALGSNNQSINPPKGGSDNGEGIWVTFVDNPDTRYLAGFEPDGLDQNEADDVDNILFDNVNAGSTGIIATVAQTGAGKVATVSIHLYNVDDPFATGRDFINDLATNDDSNTEVDAIAVRVYMR
jgi:hypothetical protein